MKKMLSGLVTIVMILGLLSCGSGNKEAKELLSRLLRLIGIPHEIVVNICQDNNRNGFCESIEPQVKITINKDDGMDTLWQKIKQTEEGSYLLETYDPSKPILLEIQDSDNIHHDEGKITLNYDGFKDNEKEKELSILESMIDAGYLTTQNVTAVKAMNSLDKFYDILLTDLEINYNTLRERELSASRAIDINIKDMARELLENNVTKEFPQSINECREDIDCLNKELEDMSIELLIDNDEIKAIVQSENNNPYGNDGNRDPYSNDGLNDPYSNDGNSDPYANDGTNDPYSNDEITNDPYSNDGNRNPYS